MADLLSDTNSVTTMHDMLCYMDKGLFIIVVFARTIDIEEAKLVNVFG